MRESRRLQREHATRKLTKAEVVAIGRDIVARNGTPEQRKRLNVAAPAPKVLSDADRRAQAARIGKLIEDEKTQQFVDSLYYPQQ